MESTSRQRKGDEGGRESTPSSGDQLAEGKESRDAGSDDDDDEEQGTRQPYKCTFCRRGFPTAQALGGHMNVHRKHRGRSSSGAAPAAAGRSSYDVVYEHQYTSVVTFAQTTHPPSMATGEEGSIMSSFHAAAERVVAEPKELRLFCAAAGRGEGGRRDVQEDRYRSKDDHGQGEELDLELRLGGAGAG